MQKDDSVTSAGTKADSTTKDENLQSSSHDTKPNVVGSPLSNDVTPEIQGAELSLGDSANGVYKQIETTLEITMSGSGSVVSPVATLSDGYGLCQIINDDHCYVVCLNNNGEYKPCTHIFKEAFNVLCNLPEPV